MKTTYSIPYLMVLYKYSVNKYTIKKINHKAVIGYDIKNFIIQAIKRTQTTYIGYSIYLILFRIPQLPKQTFWEFS